MYQRNFAWGEAELGQLVQDVIDYQARGQSYYIGVLVVFERSEEDERKVYEVIDGQQRLTALTLLVAWLKNRQEAQKGSSRKTNLDFQNRQRSKRTLQALVSNVVDGDPPQPRVEEPNGSLVQGYRTIHSVVPRKLNDANLSADDFCEFLERHVQVMRVKVPQKTDLNHYFEVMNNRGEQLEKHEILKAKLMSVLHEAGDQGGVQALHVLWESCANMDQYLQAGFKPAVRDAIFGSKNWSELQVHSFDRLRQALAPSGQTNRDAGVSIDELIDGGVTALRSKDNQSAPDDAPERFHSPSNFPNFLLHVLRIWLGKDEDVPLDDKRLMDTFDLYVLRAQDAATRVRGFALALLQCRHLYDHYILKREFIGEKDGWSLKRYRWGEQKSRGTARGYYVNTFEEVASSNSNRRILMLQAAFHVSAPTQVYKYWLSASLRWLYDQIKQRKPIHALAFLEHLEGMARAFVFDRFLASKDVGYHALTFDDTAVRDAERGDVDLEELQGRLRYGAIENNFVFNYLDYLLWCQASPSEPKVAQFQFTFRSSVEHYYPQTPMENLVNWPEADLDAFGNLCLISHQKNSRLSNLSPTAKRDYYLETDTIDSIKQYRMMAGAWDIAAMHRHGKSMIDLLLSARTPQALGERTGA